MVAHGGVVGTAAGFHIIELFESKEHPGYWHIRNTNFMTNDLTDTRRPVDRSGIWEFVKHAMAETPVDLFEWKVSTSPERRPKEQPKVVGVNVVYFLRAGDFVKIGTTVDAPKRATDLQVGCPYEIAILKTIQGGRTEEYALHKRFASLRSRNNGEWFHYRDELREYVEGLA